MFRSIITMLRVSSLIKYSKISLLKVETREPHPWKLRFLGTEGSVEFCQNSVSYENSLTFFTGPSSLERLIFSARLTHHHPWKL